MSYIEYEPEREAILEVFSNFKIESYCEIGYSNGHTFDLIPCKDKLAVDPSPKRRALSHEVIEKTSDDFFSENTKNFDCFFIDGDHSYEATLKDLNNALQIVKKGGMILGDDYKWPKSRWSKPGTTKAVNEFKEKNKFQMLQYGETQFCIKV